MEHVKQLKGRAVIATGLPAGWRNIKMPGGANKKSHLQRWKEPKGIRSNTWAIGNPQLSRRPHVYLRANWLDISYRCCLAI
jgi:hypothetical protein